MRNGLILFVVLGLAVAIGLLRAHTSPSSAAAPNRGAVVTPTTPPLRDTVYMIGGSNGNPTFVPATVTIAVGQKVTFVDKDSVDHSATATNGTFDTGVLGPGESKSVTFGKAGIYAYSDILQSNMNGQIVVKP
jgi:plastocyanin